MENMSWYNTQIRLRISDRYVSVGAQIKECHKNLIEIQKRLADKSLLHSDYEKLIDEQVWIEDRLVKLEVERDIWGQAREICLEVADEMVGEIR